MSVSGELEAYPEPDLIPITSLTPEERVRRRLERDRILDLLEEEERQAEGRQKKSVRFAGEEVDWGDVTPATLGPAKANRLIAKMRMEQQRVMKDVVERRPQAGSLQRGDSDDESNPDLISPNSRDADLIDPSLDGEERSSGSSEDDEPESIKLEDEFDMDAARHQREIALAYFEKRSVIGKDMKQVLASHAKETQNEWNQPNVPLEATLASPPPKPLISRFRADRMASTYDDASSFSTSLGSLVSAGSTDMVRGEIRTAKLEGDQLVGVDNSASEDEDDALKAALGFLRVENSPDTESGRHPRGQPAPETGRAVNLAETQSKGPELKDPQSASSSRPTFPISRTDSSSSPLPVNPVVIERNARSQAKAQFKPKPVPRRHPESEVPDVPIASSFEPQQQPSVGSKHSVATAGERVSRFKAERMS